MAYNQQLTDRVREALASINNVEEKKMFSGIAFMVEGKLCITVGDDRIMCRIDPKLHDKLLLENNCRTVVMKGREYKGYILVNEDDLKSNKAFQFWIELSLAFNKEAKASKKKTTKKKAN